MASRIKGITVEIGGDTTFSAEMYAVGIATLRTRFADHWNGAEYGYHMRK